MAAPAILGADGRPLRPAVRAEAFDAASGTSPELAGWHAPRSSADAALLPELDTIAGRTHDLVRNDGWASSAVSRRLDNVIGSGLRLQSLPDYAALGQSPEWAAEWGRLVESRWRLWADDPDCGCDATQQNTMAGLFGLAYRHVIVDGEVLALPLWLPERATATAIWLIDPARLGNPHHAPDEPRRRRGVELGRWGNPVAYHIAESHPDEPFGLSSGGEIWVRIERATAWGRRRVLHWFEAERAGQTRGKPLLAPIVERLRMLSRYDKAELQAAVVNAIFGAFIESPFDSALIEEGFISPSGVAEYQAQRKSFHEDRRLALNGVRIPHLFPGEHFQLSGAGRANAAFAAFEKMALRYVAAGVGISYEQLTQDWSETNYASARAALLEVWKTLIRSRESFGRGFATPVYLLWLEEEIDRGTVPLPPSGPPFAAAKAAYGRCRWIGPGRGWVDPVKEAQGSVIRMEGMLSTLQQECAEQGLDWEEVLDQRAREMKAIQERGLPAPSWAAASAFGPGEEDREDDDRRERRSRAVA